MAEDVAAATSLPSQPTRASLTGHRVALAAAVAVVPAVAVAVALAARRPLSVDEAAVVAAVGGDLRESLGTALESEPGQTALRAFLSPLVAADAPDWALRLPSLAAALAAGALVLQAGSVIASRLAGVVAGTLLTLSVIASEAAFETSPHAVGVLAAALSTSLFVSAMTWRRAPLWVAWALVAALAPLAHPACAGVVVAQVLALAVAGRTLPRVAMVVAPVAAVVAGLFAAAAAVERSAADGPGDESAEALAVGAARAIGWSAVALALAVLGVVALVRSGSRWQATLLVGLVAGPLLAIALGAALLPVHVAAAAVIAAPGVALAAGVGVSTIGDTRVAAAACALAAAASLAAIAVSATRASDADWREASRWVEQQRGARETVVVVPPRAREAFRHYAPDAPFAAVGRGDGVWVAVRSTPGGAVIAGRRVVATPRYALLEQRSFGDGLVVEHWVRP